MNAAAVAVLRKAVTQPRCEPGIVAEFKAMVQTGNYTGAYPLLRRAAHAPEADPIVVAGFAQLHQELVD